MKKNQESLIVGQGMDYYILVVSWTPRGDLTHELPKIEVN